MRGVAGALVVVILATMVVFVVADLAGGLGDFPNERWAGAIASICLAAWIGPRVFANAMTDGSRTLKAVALWLAVAVGLALLFIYGQDTLASLGVNV
ncbi:hypothetical protein GCM10008171_03560 [Methylopila jiangsuensis]|uniref:Uncharacterized protein n=1 Tax=Methylopila jiangsuensis TaxID=586230 RepID=A0A9W6N2K0_9HYPH|nr:hypothetical protein [Methylopila jiangsuensis]MDR6285346.1 hypothetical protein [Methylopila jiangsuensis]GLK75102.1 hypothetical protein GCM10008171_03560 [Methylopila jiangsuensis]